MILTGNEIKAMRDAGQIVIEPYDERFIEPNAYGFHLDEKLLKIDGEAIDPKAESVTKEIIIPENGYVLKPGHLYLGNTVERIGGVRFSAELFANHSTAAMGMWVQVSAQLGHVGAVINWTLEICTTQAIRVYPYMRLGKICFWQNFGHIEKYEGRYIGSDSVTASKFFLDKK